jgi:uracil-DNA glycosylase
LRIAQIGAPTIAKCGTRKSQRHGEWIESKLADYVMATVHPSAILRAPDEKARHQMIETFVNDLRAAAEIISRSIRKFQNLK